jgi:hypothetical protein
MPVILTRRDEMFGCCRGRKRSEAQSAIDPELLKSSARPAILFPARCVAEAGIGSAGTEKYRGATYQDRLFYFSSPVFCFCSP